MSAGPPAPAIELRRISKAFANVQANRDVSLTVRPGTIHGIVGENGAGKSTLMRILYGFYEADSGEILIDGRAAVIRSSREAIAAGIGMVHQHFMLIDPFTVLENVVLGAESGPLLRASLARARTELERLAAAYGLAVDLETPVGALPVGERQRVEILKALYRGARILILDEPTGVLTPQETDRLFEMFRALRGQGVTVILITHKLREIMAVTDRVSVMRAGEMVVHRDTAATSREELAELMVGRKVLLRVAKQPARPGEARLAVEGLRVRDGNGVERVRGIDLAVRAGEIVAIAGVSGNGQSHLLEALAGIRAFHAGRIVAGGRPLSPDEPPDAAAMRTVGVAHVPEDRQRMGLVMAFEAAESSILGYHRDRRYTGRLLTRARAIVAGCLEKMRRFDVRPPDPHLRTASFSGGNQQKLVLAREMERSPDILLVGQPTRGVDIGAIEMIHRSLVTMRDAGCAILLVSVELDEVMALADRILVMFDGRIVGEVPGDGADERTLGLMMANAMPGAA